MNVLVTGATGRVGRVLIEHRPGNVTAEILLSPTDPQVGTHAWYRADLTDRDRALMAMTCADPDVIVHLAAMTDVDGCERNPDLAMRVNAAGTETVALAAKECGARLLYVSTDYVFDGTAGPYAEGDVPSPVNAYGRSKLEGEQVVRDLLDDALIMRISVPFGLRVPETGHNFVSWLIEELGGGRELSIVTDQYTTPAYLDELVEVMWALIARNITGIVHYGTADVLSRYEMAEKVVGVFGFSHSLLRPITTGEIGFTAQRPLRSGFVTDRLRDLLGTSPTSFEAAVIEMMEALESSP